MSGHFILDFLHDLHIYAPQLVALAADSVIRKSNFDLTCSS